MSDPTSDEFADIEADNVAAAASYRLEVPTGMARRAVAIVTCIDTRIDPLRMFGLEPGDAKFLRNAGARVTDDVERSLAVAAAVLGVKRVAVVVHTDCRMASVTQDDAVAAVSRASGSADLATRIDYLTTGDGDQLDALRADVERLRALPVLAAGTPVAGYRLDLGSGLLHRIC
ncbi:MAG TPA: carbonic anhydrase [Acidimicrobiales bacterium]